MRTGRLLYVIGVGLLTFACLKLLRALGIYSGSSIIGAIVAGVCSVFVDWVIKLSHRGDRTGSI